LANLLPDGLDLAFEFDLLVEEGEKLIAPPAPREVRPQFPHPVLVLLVQPGHVLLKGVEHVGLGHAHEPLTVHQIDASMQV
jgi:hypothetical protein